MGEYEKQRLHGWEKFIYNMYMILTFPARKWWVILSVLATVLLVLIIIPTLEGVQKEDIWDWYKAKWTHSDVYKTKNKTIEKISRKAEEIKKGVKGVLPASEQPQAKEKKESNLVSWNVAEFKKAKFVPQAETKQTSNKKVQDSNTYALIKAEMKKKNKQTAQKVEEPEVEKEQQENEQVYYEVRTDLNLEYLDEPETIVSTATVTGANELYIDDTFVYLYGIYTSPRKYDLAEVKKFLENFIKDQEVECDIVAYSTQTQAKTALCFVNGVLLNKQMVLENMADNVALRMD